VTQINSISGSIAQLALLSQHTPFQLFDTSAANFSPLADSKLLPSQIAGKSIWMIFCVIMPGFISHTTAISLHPELAGASCCSRVHHVTVAPPLLLKLMLHVFVVDAPWFQKWLLGPWLSGAS
jgi:hypothetical protein